jgi:hypothetical protein
MLPKLMLKVATEWRIRSWYRVVVEFWISKTEENSADQGHRSPTDQG